MQDTNRNKITEHEFTKDIGHRTEDKKFGLCKECNTMKNLPVGELCGRCYFDLPVNKNNMTKTINEMFEEKKRELKDWQYGTVYKMYDREEECEVLADDVDRYFDKEFLAQLTKQIQSDLLKEVDYKLSYLSRYCRSKFVLHKTDCCEHYEGVENEPVFDMLLDEEVQKTIKKLAEEKGIN